MSKDFLFLSFTCVLVFLSACNKSELSENQLRESSTPINNIFEDASTAALYENDSTWKYEILLDNRAKSIDIPKNRLPLKNLAVFSASSIGYLEALDELKAIKGIYDSQWIYSPNLHQLINENPELDQGNLATLSLEGILALNPDAIIGYSDPNMTKTYQMLEKAGILVIYIDEYNETTPLGKAELIKLYGVLTGKQQQADELYNEIRTTYLKYKNLARKQDSKPSVFADIMRGDIWYMPGGNSFAAQYFHDAGGAYVWSNNEQSGSIKLNFEQVYELAADADIWMNVADLKSLSQVQQAYINHDWFKAFKKGQVYSLAHRMNSAGANDYFETGSVRVDWVLKDLVSIFHPKLIPNHTLYFYEKLK